MLRNFPNNKARVRQRMYKGRCWLRGMWGPRSHAHGATRENDTRATLNALMVIRFHRRLVDGGSFPTGHCLAPKVAGRNANMKSVEP